ncbi:MAG: peptide chain release factor N(5)-glutamine methyltransferase [Parachlamydiaceae bacterium]|nr:peptide chain release factor N(5)-glutamine methyltransferase [Parachlamydiaceae bacterium]
MKSLIDILKASVQHLEKKGIANPKRKAEDMLCDVLGIQRLQLYLEFERPLNDQELVRSREYLNRVGQGEPLQYVHGEVEFYGCSFFVNRDVLIPRQETEVLVDKIVQALSKIDLVGKTLLDLCCGSGCIGISIKKRFPELKVVLSDKSIAALNVARKNAERNEVEIKFLEGDLLEPFKNEKAHFIVCNPPYIAEKEYLKLEKEVRDFEPKLALISGPKGIEFYERLAHELPAHLYPGAMVWFEIGFDQGPTVYELFKGKPWKGQIVENDWAGHSRFFFLENE